MKRLLALLLLLGALQSNAQTIVGEVPIAITSITPGNELSIINDAYDGIDPLAGNRIYADLTVNFDEGKLPADFKNAWLIRTMNSDNASTGTAVVSITLDRTARVCVWHSSAIATKPAWIASDGYVNWNVGIAATTFLVGGTYDAYCDDKTGTIDFDGNTTDADDSFPMYFVTVSPLWRQPPAGVAEGSGNGEYSFLATTYSVDESTTEVVARVIRSNGSTGAVSVDITEGAGSTCAGPDSTFTDPTTINWADGVDGDGGGLSFQANAVSASCMVDLELTTAVGGISAGASNQTTTVTIEDIPAVVTDYWVAKDGSDANSCVQAQTEGTAKLTIAAGMTCLSSGETLTVKDGTYVEQSLGGQMPNGTAGDYTTVRCNTGDTCIVDPPGGALRAFDFNNGNNVTNAYKEIDGIDCDGDSVMTNCMKITGPTNYIRVKNVDWHHTGGSVILTVNNTHIGWTEAFGGHEIFDSIIRQGGQDCGSGVNPTDYGMYIAHDNTHVRGNTIHSNNGYGIQGYDSVGSPTGDVIEDNIIYNNGDQACGSSKHGGMTMQGNNNIVRNNVFYENLTSCIDLGGSGNKFFNNTCADSLGGAWSAGIYVLSSGNEARNNIIYGNAGSAIQLNGFSLTQQTNLTTDPSFTNAAADDYTIGSGSAACEAGTDLSPDVTDDIDGTARPQDSSYEIGAYETAACP